MFKNNPTGKIWFVLHSTINYLLKHEQLPTYKHLKKISMVKNKFEETI